MAEQKKNVQPSEINVRLLVTMHSHERSDPEMKRTRVNSSRKNERAK